MTEAGVNCHVKNGNSMGVKWPPPARIEAAAGLPINGGSCPSASPFNGSVHDRQRPLQGISPGFARELRPGEHPQPVQRRRRLCRGRDVRDCRKRHVLPQGRRSLGPRFRRRGENSLRVSPQGPRAIALSYWEVPDRVLEDPEELGGRDGRTPLPLPLPPRPSQNSGVRDRHATESGCFSDNR